jgi:hypothetical protein
MSLDQRKDGSGVGSAYGRGEQYNAAADGGVDAR